jgi:glycosyltransferase involved in cell wall biosynthesis
MQLVLSLSPGGTERLVIDICRQLSSRIDSTVCCLDDAGAWAPEVAALGIPVVTLGRTPGFHPSLAVQLARIMTAHRIEVVHCHHYSPFVYGLLAAVLKPGVRLVFTEHGRLSTSAPSRKRRLVNPMLAWWPGHLCAVSADLKQHMVAEGFPARRVQVLYNGIDPGARPGSAQRRLAREVLGVPHDAFVIGTAGRLDPVKNLSALIRAQAAIAAPLPASRTVIVGHGPELPALEAQVRTLGLADRVSFAGYRDDVRLMMASFDVYVNCSTYEGVSLTILEAMASALPVIATRVGGNPEVVVDRETGQLVAAHAGGLAGAIGNLAGNPLRRQAMGDAGRWRVKRHFSLARMVQQYADAYLVPRETATPTAPLTAPAA